MEALELIILAAGDSSRLLPITSDMPKCLLTVGEKTLLRHQIDTFKMHGVSSFSIVVGYKYEKILESISLDKIRLILNPDYGGKGSLYSLWLTKREYDTGVIIANSDVYLVPELVQKIVSSPADTALVDASAEWDAESTKVKVTGDRITLWSRQLSEQDWSGENIGVVKIDKDSVTGFYDVVDQLVGQGKTTSWWPEALNEFAKTNTVIPLYSSGLLCKEVDTVQDYETLVNLMKLENKAQP